VRISYFSRYAISIWAASAFLAGCGGSQPLLAPEAKQQIHTKALPASLVYRVIHRFEKKRDGGQSVAPLISVNGVLYGTASHGGTYGFGAVFRIDKGGFAKTIYSFRGGATDGADPEAGLVDVDGTLYGTTFSGGKGASECNQGRYFGCGTVFAITTSGEEKVLHYFKGYPDDGSNPAAGLLYVNGLLYGTAIGVVYRISTSGAEKVIYKFGSPPDGESPGPGNLIDVNGTLYGTTTDGGTSRDGTVYSVSTSGSEKVLYSFAGGSDGWLPEGGLTDVNGTLYGTTFHGGSKKCSLYGCGTVYAITTTGEEHVIHDFGGSDGAELFAGLTDVDGTLYGTTVNGGDSSKCDDVYSRSLGCGTIFSISASGAETVLHNFTDRSDGANPKATLLNLHGTLYGTTEYFLGSRLRGHDVLKPRGLGTVFALTP
jgi:uncharacterized repeat protein (TIGR03803 family)